jgi:hypothetical protein
MSEQERKVYRLWMWVFILCGISAFFAFIVVLIELIQVLGK